jgi:hypothetical protein
MKYDYLLIDCYNIFFRASWVEQDRYVNYNKEKIETGGIYGSLKMIERLKSLYLKPDGFIYFLFDNAKSKVNRRKILDPQYKINREQLNSSFYRGIDYFEIILKSYIDNGCIFRVSGMEADDWVLPIVNTLDKDATKLLVSNDMDWSRCINDTTHWLKKEGSSDIIIDPLAFYKNYKFYPSVSKICFYKVAYGDKIDDISPMLKQLGYDRFLRLIEDCSDINELYNKVLNSTLDYLDDGWRERILKDIDKLKLTWELVSFAEITEKDMKKYKVQCKFNEAQLKMYYTLFSFDSDIDSRIMGTTNKKSLDEILGLI